jgi:hypothetical protein
VQQSPVAVRYLGLLAPLAWDQLPEREVYPLWVPQPVSYAAFTAACLVKLDRQLVSMGALRCYLMDHPELVWLFGFPLVASSRFPWGFDVDASLPTQRHFTRMLRTIPNSVLQFLLERRASHLREVSHDLPTADRSVLPHRRHTHPPTAGSGAKGCRL